jgi:hypothetical protein
MRFTLRRFAVPITTMVAAIIFALVAEKVAFAPYNGSLASYIRYACAGLIAVSVVTTAYHLFSIWRVYKRKDFD